MLKNVLLVVFVLMVPGATNAENWPGWRGPNGDGTSTEENIPVHWNVKTGENIVWKVEVPGQGHASPIISEDRVFLVSCLTDEEKRVLCCIDHNTGKTIWQRTVIRSPLETKHSLNSYASGTPVTDGQLIYVSFLEVGTKTIPARNVGTPRPVTLGKMVVAAYDLDGNQEWLVKPGEFVSVHGYCSCPVLYEDLVIINGDHDGDSYVVALNKDTGETVWKVAREHKTRSYVTPIIRHFSGRMQMIMAGSEHVISYHPEDGSVHWKIDGPTEQFVASMVDNGTLVFLTAGYPERHILAIRPDGYGNVTDSHIVWRSKRNCAYVPSPIVVGPYFLVVSDDGIASCYEADSGQRLWFERLTGRHSASLVSAGNLVYFMADDGIIRVVRPGQQFDIVAENELGEHCDSSPAISNGHLFIRGEKHLFCIGNTSR